MGRRKKGGKKKGGIALEDAASGDEAGLEEPEMFDEVDAFESRNDDVLRKALKASERKKSGGEGNMEMFALSGTDSDSDLELPKFEKQKKKKKSKKGSAEADIQLNDEDFLGSDVEEDEANKDRAWGDKKKHFYGGNTGEGIVTSDSEYSEGEEEEKEAVKLQQRHLDRMEEEDFIDTFIINDKQEKDKEEPEEMDSSVKRDLSALTPKERAALFRQQAPEFDGIVFEFKTKIALAIQLGKIVGLEDSGQLPSGPVTEFVRIKFQILVNYCTNICAYLMFKSKGTNLKLHPVTGRLVEYKLLLDSLEPMDKIVQPQVDKVLERLSAGESLDSLKREERRRLSKLSAKKTTKKRKLKVLQKQKEESSDSEGERIKSKPKKQKGLSKPDDLTRDEEMALNLYKAIRRNKDDLEDEEEDKEDDEDTATNRVVHNDDVDLDEDEEAGEAERRGITYKIAKNKGLTPKRSKLQRNPRVKNRVKFEKAKKRRKGAVREIRSETSKYAGEISGINARVKKGVKIK